MQTSTTEYVDGWGPPAAGAVPTPLSAVAVFSLVQRHLVSGSSAGAAKSRPRTRAGARPPARKHDEQVNEDSHDYDR